MVYYSHLSSQIISLLGSKLPFLDKIGALTIAILIRYYIDILRVTLKHIVQESHFSLNGY